MRQLGLHRGKVRFLTWDSHWLKGLRFYLMIKVNRVYKIRELEISYGEFTLVLVSLLVATVLLILL